MASRFVFLPETAQFPGSGFPGLKKDVQGRMVLAYDQSTEESAYWTAVAPENFSGANNVNIVISYYMPNATSGSVVWAAAIECPTSSEDLDSAVYFSGDVSVTNTVGSVAGYYRQATITLAPANQDGLAAGNYFRLRIKRVAPSASDTAANDAHLLAVEFKDSV